MNENIQEKNPIYRVIQDVQKENNKTMESEYTEYMLTISIVSFLLKCYKRAEANFLKKLLPVSQT